MYSSDLSASRQLGRAETCIIIIIIIIILILAAEVLQEERVLAASSSVHVSCRSLESLKTSLQINDDPISEAALRRTNRSRM